MKQITALLLAVCILLSMCSCKSNADSPENPVVFYYCTAEIGFDSKSAVITPELRETGGKDIPLTEVLSLYFSGPVSDQCYSPFPAGTAVMNVRHLDSVVSITLSDTFASLQGLPLTLACTCLTRTLLDLTGCEAVEISAETALLDGSERIYMTADNILLMDAHLTQAG